MIRSGLANVQKAGYVGYPHERDPNARNDIARPFVSVGDVTVLKKSDYSDPLANPITVPAPIMYNDIFAKRTTSDERVYVLKQIQQGLEKIQKGILGKDSQQVKPPPLPRQPGQVILLPQAGSPSIPTVPGSTTDNPVDPVPVDASPIPGLLIDSPIEDGNNLEEEEEAQDVVSNPPAAPTMTEQERAAEEWLHMQHSPQWRQIEGRPFNSASSFHTASSGASTEYGTVSSWSGPDSSGSYPTPSPRYPTLPPLYPELNFTPSTSGHSFTVSSLSSAATAASSSPNPNIALDYIQNEIHGYPLEQQREFFRNLSMEQRENIAAVVLANPNHPITREPVFQAEIPLFSPGTTRGLTPLNSSGLLTAGTSNSFSSVTPSPRSLASTISSNGVGPRRRSTGPRTADSRMSVPMSVDSPPPRRRFSRENAPPPIDTQAAGPRRPRDRTDYARPGRPQTIADVDRLLQNGLRPQSRRNYYESPQT